MRAFRNSAAGALILLTASVAAAPALAANCPGAEAVKAAANGFLSAAKSGSASAFSAALGRHTNVDSLAIFALGKYRSDLPADRRSEYVRNAQRYMGKFLAGHAARFRGSSLTVEGCKGNLVETSTGGGGEITWRVSGGRIQDVRVGGIWLALQLRKKFTDIVRRGNNRVETLLGFLERNN